MYTITIDQFALMGYVGAVTMLLVIISIQLIKIKNKLKSIESSWHSFILSPHKRKHKYPLDHV